ncbi:MRG domain-containing protein [Mycena leptocephala]|nr:MRG domain-containing protein [Mycena leptocephala]
MKDKKLVTLPRSPTVRELLKEFETYVKDTRPVHLKNPLLLIPAVVSGIKVYFDCSLGNHLLYRPERPQYGVMRAKYITGQTVVVGQEKEMSEIYGAEHLLRMLVTLPTMIAQSTLDAESTNIVRDYVNELLGWMLQEQARLFQYEYVPWP